MIPSRNRVLVVASCAWLAVGCSESSSGSVPELVASNLELAAFELFGAENLWLIPVSESASGATDLNGDGDALDFVFHVHDPSLGTTTNLELAASEPNREPRDVAPPSPPQFQGSRALFFVEESAQGGLDLLQRGAIVQRLRGNNEPRRDPHTEGAEAGEVRRLAADTLGIRVGAWLGEIDRHQGAIARQASGKTLSIR